MCKDACWTLSRGESNLSSLSKFRFNRVWLWVHFHVELAIILLPSKKRLTLSRAPCCWNSWILSSHSCRQVLLQVANWKDLEKIVAFLGVGNRPCSFSLFCFWSGLQGMFFFVYWIRKFWFDQHWFGKASPALWRKTPKIMQIYCNQYNLGLRFWCFSLLQMFWIRLMFAWPMSFLMSTTLFTWGSAETSWLVSYGVFLDKNQASDRMHSSVEAAEADE